MMNSYPLLLTMDYPDNLGPVGYEIHRLEYHQGATLRGDRWGVTKLVRPGAQAAGWGAGLQPLAQPRGYGRLRYEVNPSWSYAVEPVTAWPPPHRVVLRGPSGVARVLWDDASLEVVDLQVVEGGAYFVTRTREGQHQLRQVDKVSGRCQTLLSARSFRVSEFAVSPDRSAIAYVDFEDDQVYLWCLRSGSRRQLSIPQLEDEAGDQARVYRSSPTFSPDGQRIFYCTAYLEMRALDLCGWGGAYVVPVEGGALRALTQLGEGFPLQVFAPVAAALDELKLEAA